MFHVRTVFMRNPFPFSVNKKELQFKIFLFTYQFFKQIEFYI